MNGFPPQVLVAVGFVIFAVASLLAFHELRRNPPFENSERKVMREKHDLELRYYVQHYEGVAERLRQAVKESRTWDYRENVSGLSGEQITRKLKPKRDLRKDFDDLRVIDLYATTPKPPPRPEIKPPSE